MAQDEKMLAESLARYLSPEDFEDRRRSSRNQHAAKKARSHYRKLARRALRFKPIAAALSAAPAQDEGAAGEPVAWRKRPSGQHPLFRGDFTGVEWRVSVAKPDLGEGSQPEWFDIQPLYAHPSPAPAADADRVRIAVELINAEINAPLTGPTHGAWDRGRIAGLKEALAALKSSEVEKMSAQRRDLIKRLAKAECGSRELDKAIFEATSPPAEYAEWSPRLRGYQYTTSIDAALSWAEWVLPGQEWRFGSGTRDTTLPWARIGRWAEPDAVGATPALAICGAILIALNRAEIEATRSPSATLAALKSTAAKEGGE